MCRTIAHPSQPPRGSTLLEVIVAGTLLAIALVPALRIMRDGLSIGRQLDERDLMVTFCTSTLEEHLALASADWQEGAYSGDLSTYGHPELRYSVTKSDDAAGGGIADELMVITATVWCDEDSDGLLDTGEPSIVLASKVAKLSGYQEQAGSG